MHFRAGFVQSLDRRTGKLELATRFEADIRPPLVERDRHTVLVEPLPAELIGETVEKCADADLTIIGKGFEVGVAVSELFVFRTYSPGCFRFAAAFQVLDQLPIIGDRRTFLSWWC